jgi:hypothetical protein
MTTEAPTIIPEEIVAYWLENNDFLHEFALLKRWSPFEAACLLKNYKPAPIVRGVAKVGRVIEIDHSEYDIENPNDNFSPAEISTLTRTIFLNFDKKTEIDCVEIVQWAVDNFLINEKSFLVSRFLKTSDAPSRDDLLEQLSILQERLDEAEKLNSELQLKLTKKEKNTGKHHAEARFKILSAVLNEVCIHTTWEPIISKTRIVAAKMAKHLDQIRDVYDLPLPTDDDDEYGYSLANMTCPQSPYHF